MEIKQHNFGSCLDGSVVELWVAGGKVGVQFPLVFFFMRLEDKGRKTPDVLQSLNTVNNFNNNVEIIFQKKKLTLNLKKF